MFTCLHSCIRVCQHVRKCIHKFPHIIALYKFHPPLFFHIFPIHIRGVITGILYVIYIASKKCGWTDQFHPTDCSVVSIIHPTQCPRNLLSADTSINTAEVGEGSYRVLPPTPDRRSFSNFLPLCSLIIFWRDNFPSRRINMVRWELNIRLRINHVE